MVKAVIDHVQYEIPEGQRTCRADDVRVAEDLLLGGLAGVVEKGVAFCGQVSEARLELGEGEVLLVGWQGSVAPYSVSWTTD